VGKTLQTTPHYIADWTSPVANGPVQSPIDQSSRHQARAQLIGQWTSPVANRLVHWRLVRFAIWSRRAKTKMSLVKGKSR
jgi:hypothetical protein